MFQLHKHFKELQFHEKILVTLHIFRFTMQKCIFTWILFLQLHEKSLDNYMKIFICFFFYFTLLYVFIHISVIITYACSSSLKLYNLSAVFKFYSFILDSRYLRRYTNLRSNVNQVSSTNIRLNLAEATNVIMSFEISRFYQSWSHENETYLQ